MKMPTDTFVWVYETTLRGGGYLGVRSHVAFGDEDFARARAEETLENKRKEWKRSPKTKGTKIESVTYRLVAKFTLDEYKTAMTRVEE
jgi:hypothetical protein